MTDEIFLLIIWLWVKRCSTDYLAEEVGLSSRTVSGYLRLLRARIEGSGLAYPEKLDGVVHLDVWTYRPKPTPIPQRMSPSPNRPMLLGMMDKEGRLRLFVVQKKGQADIHSLVKSHVVRGATIIANRSNVFSGLRKDGFPNLVQKSKRQLIQEWVSSHQENNLYYFWDWIRHEIKCARGVRNTNFMQRVREIELRWRFRNLPHVQLYSYIVKILHD